MFSSLDVLTEDFFNYLSDHSSILDKPPLGLDADSLKSLIGSFYKVGIIIGAVYALTVLPATFGGILGKINALAGVGLMKKGLKVAVGAPAAAALAVSKKGTSVVGNRLAVTKAGTALSSLKRDATRAAQDRYHTSMLGRATQAKRERKADRAQEQLEKHGFSMFDKDGKPVSDIQQQKMFDEAGVASTDKKELLRQHQRGERKADGSFKAKAGSTLAQERGNSEAASREMVKELKRKVRSDKKAYQKDDGSSQKNEEGLAAA